MNRHHTGPYMQRNRSSTSSFDIDSEIMTSFVLFKIHYLFEYNMDYPYDTMRLQPALVLNQHNFHFIGFQLGVQTFEHHIHQSI